ncbi:MAG TPA: type VII secretion protein EssC [Firmicutes bacterium]|nr:type VII secretion protein EssC [Bacillota bacterium]
MRVLLLDNEKITKMTLPDEIDGFFTMNYKPIDSRVIKDINIEAIDGKWHIKSNETINVVVNGNIETEAILEDYMKLNIFLIGKNEMLDFYCIPTVDKNKYKVNVSTDQILIGNTQKCSIIFNNYTNEVVYAGIINQNGKSYISYPQSGKSANVYVNDKAISSSVFLKVGDIIFINGVKIIWMKDFMQICVLQGDINTNPLYLTNYVDDTNYNNTVYEPVTEEDQSLELYQPDDYFFHKPNLKEYVKDEEIVIDPPPQKQMQENDNFLATFGASFTMIASSFVSIINLINNINNNAKPLTIITSGIMCVSMVAGSLVIPKLATQIQKQKEIKREKYRIKKYTEYLESCNEKIKLIMSKQTQLLRDTNIKVDNCINLVNGASAVLWNRDIKDEDFLIVRLGIGNVPARIRINAPEEHFTLEEDFLVKNVYEVVNSSRILEDVPVTFNFLKNRVSAIISNEKYGEGFVNSVIMQLATLHSSQDLKMAFFINNNEDNFDWDYAKYLPHTFSDDKTVRYYADSYDEMKILSTELEKIFKDRMEKIKAKDNDGDIDEESNTYRVFDNYFILITNDVFLAKSLPIFGLAMDALENYGFSVVFINKTMNKLPKRCNAFVALSDDTGCVIEKNINSQTTFAPEILSGYDLKVICYKLMNIPVMSADVQSTLPTSISFLDVFKASKIEQLNIANRWKLNDPTISLAVPIGVHANGEDFILDLHEKFHGPHGLIAGSTGSGKSEFIITFVLAMCVNFHPDEVQFVLIDYKGGGLAGAFENREKGFSIPHLAGTITNLDTSSMNRSLVSINSELKRREQMFMDVRDITGESTIDIYKYQKYYREGIIKEPISHLFIVSDEFAELKAQQPDFMAELISTARVGRSLGVHLILATQKPSGVVNEQIWSNTRFRVCLKVQTSGDSNEMLKRPDAASIKEAGRFYLQVGYDEYFDIGQSGWAGAKYVPTDRVIKKVDDSLVFINNVGSVIKSINDFVKKETSEDIGDQLTNIVKHLVNWSKKENYSPKKLWLDPIPELIYIANLAKKYNYTTSQYNINPIIGEYDDPSKQYQGLLTLDLAEGNTYIFGKSGSGKEDLLATIIYGSCLYHSPEEIVFYIVDMGAETLRQFIKFPQVADVCTVDDGNKIIDMMVLLEREISRRKDLTVDFGGSFKTYNELNEKKLPLYCVIINYLDIFTENFAKVAELIIPLYRDGSKYGVNFIVTSSSVASLRARVRDYFNYHICLQMANSDDYSTVLNKRPRKLVPSNYKGRGLIELKNGVYEFQTALIYLKQEIPNIIRNTAESLGAKYKNSIVQSIPSVPKVVSVDGLINFVNGLANVPIGYDVESKDKYFYNFEAQKANIIVANSFENHKDFLNALMIEFKSIPDVDIKVIDFSELFDILTIGLTCYQNNFNDVFGHIIGEAEKLTKHTFYIITGISKLRSSVKQNNISFINQYFIDSLKNKYIHFLFVDLYDELNKLKLEDWYEKIINPKYGIWLGEGVGSQLLIKFENLTADDKRVNNSDYIFAAKDGKRSMIKKVVVKDESETNNDGK